MNVITPYEQLVAQEMDHLPLPDSMENIWAEIETQLDVELPSGGGKNPPPRKPAPARRSTPGRWIRNWRFFAMVGVVVVTVFLLVPKNKRGSNRERNAVPPSKTELPDSMRPQVDTSEIYDFFTEPAPGDTGNKVPQPAGRSSRANTPKNADNKLTAPTADSPVFISLPAFIDTAANRPGSPLLINPPPTARDNKPPGLDSSKTTPPGRKSRGVKDIGDSDYRLIPLRKDSTPKSRN